MIRKLLGDILASVLGQLVSSLLLTLIDRWEKAAKRKRKRRNPKRE
jgi:hypothetical protein